MENSEFGESNDFFVFTEIAPLDSCGSTSDTFKVRINGKWHFLKRPKQEYKNHPQYNAAFGKEFDIGYTLDHPNIVRYIAKGKDKNGFYFLTEYIDGQTLKDFILDNRDYFKQKEHITKFVNQLLSAISYLHKKQVLHLDLKADNIMITNIRYDVKIVDLGFAYSDCYQFLTSGKTNLYAAPEQISNGKIDQRTDIYGIGMVLLYVFTQTTNKKLLKKIPQPYKSILSKCLNENIEERYFDISVLNKDIAKSSKNRLIMFLLLLFIILGIILFFLIKPHLTKGNEIPIEAVEDVEAPIDSITIYVMKEDTPQESKKNIVKSESTIVVVRPSAEEISMDLFCSDFRDKSKNELSKIFSFEEPVSYSLEDQEKRYQQTWEFQKQWVNSIEDYELKNELKQIFWSEYIIIAFPYIREQFLAYLHKAKNQIIPEEIIQSDDVYRLIDKEMAEKFIVFMNEYPTIRTKEDGGKLAKLFNEYDRKKEDIYKQYSHLFKNKNKFEEGYYPRNKYDHCISYINDWLDIMWTWSLSEYRTNDNPYVKIKN